MALRVPLPPWRPTRQGPEGWPGAEVSRHTPRPQESERRAVRSAPARHGAPSAARSAGPTKRSERRMPLYLAQGHSGASLPLWTWLVVVGLGRFALLGLVCLYKAPLEYCTEQRALMDSGVN